MTVIDNTQEHSTRILLVEDHASFRQALAFMFAREGEFAVAGQTGSLAEARAFLRKTPTLSTSPSLTSRCLTVTGSGSSRSFLPVPT